MNFKLNKTKAIILLNVVIFVFMLSCLYRIRILEDKIVTMQDNLYSQFNILNQNINNISSTVRNSLDEEDTLLSAQTWEYGDIDSESSEIKVDIKISPKVYNKDNTKVFLVMNGKDYAMELLDEGYVGTINIPLLSESKVESVKLEENGNIRSQQLDWYLNPRYEYLGTVQARFSGSSSMTNSKDSGIVHRKKGYVQIDMDNKEGIESIHMITALDGVEIEREQVDMSYIGQQGYAKKASSYNRAISIPESHNGDHIISNQFIYYLEEKAYTIPSNGSYELYAEVIDSKGFTHIALADYYEVDEQGKIAEDIHERWNLVGAEASIYDSNGKLIYDKDGTLYTK